MQVSLTRRLMNSRKAVRFCAALTAAALAVSLVTPLDALAAANVITVNTATAGINNSDGFCSIDEAVQNANDDAATNANCPAGKGKDTINFDIAPSGVQFLHNATITTDWLVLTSPVIIDGTSEDGYFDDYVPRIRLDNDDNNGSIIVLESGAKGSTIKGVTFGNSQGAGILANASGSHTFLGNYFSVDGTAGYVGLSGNGLSNGIKLVSSDANKIGGPSNILGNSNFFGHLEHAAVQIDSGSKNSIKGNYIGQSPMNGMGNEHGIVINAGTGNTIGGTGLYDGNVISSNALNGISLDGLVSKTTIQRNIIGLTANGMSNAGNNVGIRATNGAITTTIGGTKGGSGNVISANSSTGVYLFGGTGHLVQGNIIGLTALGTLSGVDNIYAGVWLDNSGSATLVNNVIAGHTSGAGYAIELDGTASTTTKSVGNCLINNNVGVNQMSSGVANLAKGWWGASDGPNPPGSGQTIIGIGTGAVNTTGFLTAIPTYCDKPGIPTLVKPVETGSFFPTVPTLSWKSVKGATGYEVQTSPDSFTTVHSTLVSKPSLATKAVKGVPAPFGFYEWRVRSIGPNGIAGDFSTTGQYQVTVLKSPGNATNVGSTTVKFTWNKEPNSTSYEFYIDTDTNPMDGTQIHVNGTTTTQTGLNFATLYYWTVKPNGENNATINTIPPMGIWFFATPGVP